MYASIYAVWCTIAHRETIYLTKYLLYIVSNVLNKVQKKGSSQKISDEDSVII